MTCLKRSEQPAPKLQGSEQGENMTNDRELCTV
jgi:hypothetical protein